MHRFILKSVLSEIVRDQKIIASGIGPNGEACLLTVPPRFANEPFGREERKGQAIFPLSISRKPYPATFLRFDGNLLQRTELPELELAFPFVQPLPNGEILVVGARCHYRNGDPDMNAVVFSPDGVIVRRFVLGDGINDVQTARDGLIWVSFFDEGVFGNYGWDKPIGKSGLVCFDLEGHVSWEFEPPAGVDPIADCYALNVAAESVWACYYTDFPVVKVDATRQVRAWKNDISGAKAIAVDDRRIALWGGYGDRRSRCVVQEIADGTLMNPIELEVGFPDGISGPPMEVIGRDGALHAFVGTSWLCFDL